MNLDIRAVFDKVRAWRYGETGITGLNQAQNNIKLVVIITIPFLSVWFSITYAINRGMIPKEVGSWLSLASIFGWLFYIVGVWAWATTDGSKYKVMPQTTTFFPDLQEKKFTFVVAQGGIKKRCEWKDGSVGIELTLLNRYLFHQTSMDFPYVFDRMLLKIPASIGDSFEFNSQGEFWHKGMVIQTSNCQHVSIYIYNWVREEDRWKPVGVLADCPFNFKRAKAKFDFPTKAEGITQANANWLLYQNTLKRNEELRRYNVTLEQSLAVALQHGGKKVKNLVDQNLEAIRSCVADVMDVKESLWKRAFNFMNVLKVIIVVVILYCVAHFLFGVI